VVIAAPNTPAVSATSVQSWLTTGDQRGLPAPVTGLTWGTDPARGDRVVVDDAWRGQVFRGAGAAPTERSPAAALTLTGGAVQTLLRCVPVRAGS
jgi:hypothetical protein